MLLQFDWDKHNELCEKYWNNTAQYWGDRSPELIERFLQDFYNDKSIELVGIMQGANVGNGFPYWVFMYNCK